MNDHPMFGDTSAALSRRDLLKGGALIVGFAMAGLPQGATAATGVVAVRRLRSMKGLMNQCNFMYRRALRGKLGREAEIHIFDR